MRSFEDHFSQRADAYVRYRPVYPPELYAYLASVAPDRRLAWDCGTGNGQAAVGLVDFFDRVIATDASGEQLAQAPAHSRIEYKIASAESSGLASESAGLVTVAVAVHWFDLGRFYAEVRRVLLPKGVIAVWCYSVPAIEPGIDAIVKRYLQEILSGYWPDRFRYVKEQYRTLPFPFEEMTAPMFTMETQWDLAQVIGFLYSWSGTLNYEKRKGQSPIDLIKPELKIAWGAEGDRRILKWRIHLRIGRVDGG